VRGLTLIGTGLSNAQIAERLHISPATVRTHIGHLLAKLQARDRAQLVIAAYEASLITPHQHQVTINGLRAGDDADGG
jgi:DNA-binding NarL/FixJ family response regulator